MSMRPPTIDVQAGLERHFGLKTFRPGQAQVVEAVLSGRNVVVVMPTGAGKSLCYQLPATLLDGVTLVISPLIALMKDQVEQLEGRGISATFINSTLGDAERAQRLHKLRSGAYKLVYVAPERFKSPAFLDALSEVKVELFAIDEAHCISQWGHDFRPDYALLGQVRKRLRPPRTVALTATATPEVQADLVRVLLLKEPQIFVAGFDRPNLFLEVFSVTGDDEKRTACDQLVGEGGSGIIYCSTRKATEAMHASLTSRGVQSVLYHAGMGDDERRKAQDQFMSSPRAVAVATNAFGMGIDKPDIRFVAHANIPKAVEAYYQEIGRAGRDGQPARTVLLFNHADVFTQERLIQGSHPPDAVFADLWNLLLQEEHYERGLGALATQVGTSEFEVSAALKLLERAGKIQRSVRGRGTYGITVRGQGPGTRLGSADARALLQSLRDHVGVGQSIVSELSVLARRAGLEEEKARHALTLLEKRGAIQVRKPFAGRTIQVLDPRPFSQLQLDLSQVREQERQALRLLRRMTDYAYGKGCRRAFLLRYFGEKTQEENCGHCDVCAGPRLKRRPEGRSSSGPRSPVATGHSELAAEELRRWRRELARELDIPAFIIFNDATLFGLASSLPSTREEFLAVKGTGGTRWERFGPKVLEICSVARAAGHLPQAAPASPRRKKR